MDDATPEKLPPDAVGHRPGKKRVLRGKQPVGQGLSRVNAGGRGQRRSSQRCGLHHLVADRMTHAPAGGVVNELGSGRDRRRDAGALALRLGEEGGELVKVALAPLLVGMVVATGTLHSHAEKGLAEKRRQRRRFTARAIDHRRANLVRAAPGREDFAHHLVVRLVGGEAFANPVVNRVGALEPDTRDVRPEQIAPAVRPRVGVPRIVKQAVDQLGAFVRRLIGKKTPHLGRLRQQADRVDEGAPDKLRVAAKVARQQTQLLKTSIRQVIDEIVARQPGVHRVVEPPVGRHRDPRLRHLAHVAHDDHPLAAERAHPHQAVVIHPGDLLVA